MRQVLVILGVAVVLLGPLNEWTHHHDPGSRDVDCVACHFHHAASEPPSLARGVLAPPPAAVERSEPELVAPIAVDPLRVAPKTSPPSPCSRS